MGKLPCEAGYGEYKSEIVIFKLEQYIDGHRYVGLAFQNYIPELPQCIMNGTAWLVCSVLHVSVSSKVTIIWAYGTVWQSVNGPKQLWVVCSVAYASVLAGHIGISDGIFIHIFRHITWLFRSILYLQQYVLDDNTRRLIGTLNIVL